MQAGASSRWIDCSTETDSSALWTPCAWQRGCGSPSLTLAYAQWRGRVLLCRRQESTLARVTAMQDSRATVANQKPQLHKSAAAGIRIPQSSQEIWAKKVGEAPCTHGPLGVEPFHEIVPL